MLQKRPHALHPPPARAAQLLHHSLEAPQVSQVVRGLLAGLRRHLAGLGGGRASTPLAGLLLQVLPYLCSAEGGRKRPIASGNAGMGWRQKLQVVIKSMPRWSYGGGEKERYMLCGCLVQTSGCIIVS